MILLIPSWSFSFSLSFPRPFSTLLSPRLFLLPNSPLIPRLILLVFLRTLDLNPRRLTLPFRPQFPQPLWISENFIVLRLFLTFNREKWIFTNFRSGIPG